MLKIISTPDVSNIELGADQLIINSKTGAISFDNGTQRLSCTAAPSNVVSGVRMLSGSYTGNGKYGQANPNNIPMEFLPQIVFIYKETYGSLSAEEQYTYNHNGSNHVIFYANANKIIVPASTGSVSNDDYIHYIASNNGLSWYSFDAEYQLNIDGEKYYYIALG